MKIINKENKIMRIFFLNYDPAVCEHTRNLQMNDFLTENLKKKHQKQQQQKEEATEETQYN